MLKGITRKQVLAIALENNITIRERDIHLDELPFMAGAFLSATTKGVLPVVKIDEQQIGDGSVHKLAKKFYELYQARVNDYLAKALQNQNT